MRYIKNELKDLRDEIRSTRLVSKTDESMTQRGYAQCDLIPLKERYRYTHIFSCLLHHTPYLHIERKTRKGNEASIGMLKYYAKDYEGLSFDEISPELLEGMV